MPDVHYNLGEMYGGSIPINEEDPSRQLYFIFKPKIGASAPLDEITIYLNGGPGCSSLDAFFQENGPFVWQPGTFLPSKNPYSWATMTNMLWVDQPVGTGFATGKITANGEVDIAKDFVSWFKNFQTQFGIKVREEILRSPCILQMLTTRRIIKSMLQVRRVTPRLPVHL